MPITQLIINSLVLSSSYILIGLSVACVYQTARFLNFSIAAIYTLACYILYFLINSYNLPFYLSILLSIIICVLMASILEVAIFKRIRRNKSSYLISVLTSFGVYIVLQNVISLLFGDRTKIIRIGKIKEGMNVLGGRITEVQIIIIVSTIFTILIFFFINRLKIGKAMQAVSDDPELSNISGVSSDRIILLSSIIGFAMTGVAGILVSLETGMTPTMGISALMMGVVAMIVGGLNSILGIIFGALLLSLSQNIGIWYLGAQWKDAIAFLILIIFLLFRPQGFFGLEMKKTAL